MNQNGRGNRYKPPIKTMATSKTSAEITHRVLKSYLQQLTDIGNDIRRESRVYEEELTDRLRLGLIGDEAIVHYNKWMEREGMPHLKVVI